MHRALASLLIPALMAMLGMVPALHTHVYDDHDHPEHHHGPSAHEHHAVPGPTDRGMAHLERCDPGNHVVSFAFICAAPPQVNAVDADLSLPASPEAELQAGTAVRHSDVRVHGPPPRTQASPRGPPPIARLIT